MLDTLSAFSTNAFHLFVCAFTADQLNQCLSFVCLFVYRYLIVIESFLLIQILYAYWSKRNHAGYLIIIIIKIYFTKHLIKLHAQGAHGCFVYSRLFDLVYAHPAFLVLVMFFLTGVSTSQTFSLFLL